jgi:hypothetical protein
VRRQAVPSDRQRETGRREREDAAKLGAGEAAAIGTGRGVTDRAADGPGCGVAGVTMKNFRSNDGAE